MSSSPPSARRVLGSLWLRVYLPNLVIAIGQGAMIPVLVYAAERLHASSAAAGGLVALNGLGTLLFDLPSGRILARLGERASSSAATVLLVAGLLGCIAARDFALLAVAVLVQAAGMALWSLVRMTHLSRSAPPHLRGRALSLFGGVVRAGNVIGPFAFIAFSGHHDVLSAFVIYLICVLIGAGWLVAARDRGDDEAGRARSEPIRLAPMLREHRATFLTAGVGSLGISLLRGSRNAIVSLWAAHLGLSATQAAAIFAYSSLVDLALFYPSGVASDRLGRRVVLLSSIVVLSVGHILVPFSHAYGTLFLAALVLGIGNGLGSGIVMILGADFMPGTGRASFLAMWRLISDGGTTAGPLVDSAVVALGALSLAGPVVGFLGLACALWVAVRLDEPLHRIGPPGAARAGSEASAPPRADPRLGGED